MANEQIPLSPVAAWDIGTIPAYNAAFMKLHFLLHPMQPPEQAQPSQTFLLTQEQCRELIQQLQRAVQRLESAPQQGAGLPKH